MSPRHCDRSVKRQVNGFFVVSVAACIVAPFYAPGKLGQAADTHIIHFNQGEYFCSSAAFATILEVYDTNSNAWRKLQEQARYLFNLVFQAFNLLVHTVGGIQRNDQVKGRKCHLGRCFLFFQLIGCSLSFYPATPVPWHCFVPTGSEVFWLPPAAASSPACVFSSFSCIRGGIKIREKGQQDKRYQYEGAQCRGKQVQGGHIKNINFPIALFHGADNPLTVLMPSIPETPA